MEGFSVYNHLRGAGLPICDLILALAVSAAVPLALAPMNYPKWGTLRS